jgi:hypothetical protein
VNLADKIQQHNAAMRRNSRERIQYRKRCATCDGYDCFAPHELRPRELRYVVGMGVIRAKIVLARWRCIMCDRRFTDYPDFRTAV